MLLCRPATYAPTFSNNAEVIFVFGGAIGDTVSTTDVHAMKASQMPLTRVLRNQARQVR